MAIWLVQVRHEQRELHNTKELRIRKLVAISKFYKLIQIPVMKGVQIDTS